MQYFFQKINKPITSDVLITLNDKKYFDDSDIIIGDNVYIGILIQNNKQNLIKFSNKHLNKLKVIKDNKYPILSYER